MGLEPGSYFFRDFWDCFRLFKIKEKFENKPIYAYKNIDIGTFPLCNKYLIQHIKLPVDDSEFRLQCLNVIDQETPMVSEEHGFTYGMFWTY